MTGGKLPLVGVAGDKIYAQMAARRRPGYEDRPGSLLNEYPFVYSYGSYLFDVGTHLNRLV